LIFFPGRVKKTQINRRIKNNQWVSVGENVSMISENNKGRIARDKGDGSFLFWFFAALHRCQFIVLYEV